MTSVYFADGVSKFVDSSTPVIEGDARGATAVEIYNGDPSNGGRDLGGASVNGDGTWTFQANIGPGDFNDLRAVATDGLGQTAMVSAPFEIITGIKGEPYQAQQFYGSPWNSTYTYVDYDRYGTVLVDAINNNNSDNDHLILVEANKQTIQSVQNDFILSNGTSESFVFSPNFGHDTISGFHASGKGHDTIDLTNTQFTTLAQVLHHTTMSGGDAVIHVNLDDMITVGGVTRAELKAHPHDFAFA